MELTNIMVIDSPYCSLHEDMKNLELSVNKEIKQPIKTNAASTECSNRRYFLRPKKRTSVAISENNNDDNELVNFYNVENKKPKLQKRKRRNTHLETIFEEPVVKKNGSVVLIGTSKVKRSITFSNFITKTKQNKRKAQIQKHKVGKNRSKNYKLSLKDLEIKLDEMDISRNSIT
ncbi:uncharacterized protein LOC142323810 [Lycorma delicatula]|uniref:uncharacterized protein LOC142323810 n=1 Tax=Lycorma delicatula TaxID=130591 RepID=UPI003F510428